MLHKVWQGGIVSCNEQWFKKNNFEIADIDEQKKTVYSIIIYISKIIRLNIYNNSR